MLAALPCIALMRKKPELGLIKHWLSRINKMKAMEELTGSVKGSEMRMEIKCATWREFTKEDAFFGLWFK